MTDRERLIELKINFIENFDCGNCKPSNDKCKKCLSEKEADYLLANGVIVPQCKVGDTVYIINRANKLQEMIFDSVDLRFTCANDADCMCGSLCNDIVHNVCQHRFKNDFSDFGKTVFLTREEAEKALKERSDNE